MYTQAAVLSNSTRKLWWLETSIMLITHTHTHTHTHV